MYIYWTIYLIYESIKYYYYYIVDIFYVQASPSLVERTRDTIVRLHLQMGFVINLAKSSLVPSRIRIHLGAPIDTFVGIVSPTPDKVRGISHLSQNLLASGSVSARSLQQQFIPSWLATPWSLCVCFGSV